MKSLVPQLDGSDLVRGCLGLLCLSHFSGFHWSWMTAPGANGLKKAAPTSVKGGRTRTLNWYPIGFDEPIGSLDTLRRFFFTLFWWVYTGYIGYTGAWDEHPTEAGPEMVYGWVPGAVTTKHPSWLDMVKARAAIPTAWGCCTAKKSLKCWRPKCKRETESSFVSYTRRHSYKKYIHTHVYTYLSKYIFAWTCL